MKLTIGKPARGEKFYPRKKIRELILEKLEEEANILISAPRRVGKTSILMDIYDNPPPKYIVVYLDTEAVSEINEFFKKLLNELFDIELLEKYSHLKGSLVEKLTKFADRIKSFKVAGTGIDLKDKEEPWYYDEFIKFLEETDLEGNKILMLIDEFPVTIENINKNHSLDDAKRFLQINRSIRLHPKLNQKIQFIYTGSIGLVNVLSKMNTTEDVNDLEEFLIPPLKDQESVELLTILLGGYDINISHDIAKYTINLIQWQIPFYIQSFAREIRNLHRERDSVGEINEVFIDQALENVIDHVNLYLDHYRSRLHKTFAKNELSFINDLLNKIANDAPINSEDIPELAAQYNATKEVKHILSTLEYDGYINNKNKERLYLFNSPIMKLWWKKYGDK